MLNALLKLGCTFLTIFAYPTLVHCSISQTQRIGIDAIENQDFENIFDAIPCYSQFTSKAVVGQRAATAPAQPPVGTTEISTLPSYGSARSCVSPCSIRNDFEQIPAAAALIALTTDPVNIQNILVYDMYHVTYALQTRALTTYPTLSPLLQDTPLHCWDITTKPFYILTPHMRFTPQSDKVCSYLTFLSKNNFLQELDDDLFTTFDIPSVLPLLGNITIEQRQLGLMFYLQGQRQRWFGSIALPVYYLENNYQLSPQDKARLENSPLFGGASQFPVLIPSLDPATFTDDHFISDKLGIGDTRVEVWYRAADGEQGFADVGLQMTVPTAIAAVTGIIGAMPGTFCKTRPVPYVDLQSMVSLYLNSQDPSNPSALANKIDLASYTLCLGLEALDKLSSVILDAPLGEQHATIGAVTTCIGRFNHSHLAIQVSGEATYYIPSHEIRFFKTIIDPALLVHQNYNIEQNNEAQILLNALSQRATDILFPTATSIIVHPGFMYNLTMGLVWEKPSYKATLGFNMWGRTREHFGSLSKRYPVVDPLADQFSPPRYIPTNNFNFEKGARAGAYSGKVFGTITSVIRSTTGYDVHIGLRGDATVFTSNIGYDFTLGADFIIDF